MDIQDISHSKRKVGYLLDIRDIGHSKFDIQILVKAHTALCLDSMHIQRTVSTYLILPCSSSQLLNIIYLSCAYYYKINGYLDNATLVNIHVLSILLYYALS